jgi:hypothetical protein
MFTHSQLLQTVVRQVMPLPKHSDLFVEYMTMDMVQKQYQLKTTTINPLKSKLAYIMFNNLVRTAKKTPHFTITSINFFMLFKQIIPVYTDVRII